MPVPRLQAGNRGMPTMQNVADHAGVSIATVSNVLNYPDKVTAPTAERVRSSIEALGFVRNDAGRSLATGSSSSIGMVLADFANSLFPDMAQGAQDAALAQRLRVVMGNSGCSIQQQDAYLDLFDEARMQGLLLAPMEDSTAGIRRMRSHGRQIVLLNYTPEPGEACAVVVDNAKIGYLAAKHLIDLGRTRIAYLAMHEDYQPVHDRRLGVREAIAETGGRVVLEEITTESLQAVAGRDVARVVLGRPEFERPDGVIAVTDEMAHGFIAEILASGVVAIPAQIAVVGCEGNRMVEAGPLPLTTVQHPGRLMGAEAMSLLLDELAAEGGEHEHRTVVFAPTLIVRETTVASRPVAVAAL